jgi:hypothetical protein
VALTPDTPALELDSPWTPWPLVLKPLTPRELFDVPSIAGWLWTVKAVVSLPSCELPTVTVSPSAALTGTARAIAAAAAAAAAPIPAVMRARRLRLVSLIPVVIDMSP